MKDMLLILKMLLPSIVISIAIKYLAPSLQIAPTITNAIAIVFFPTILMMILLGWHHNFSHSDRTNHIT